jgi:hypothetical protein
LRVVKPKTLVLLTVTLVALFATVGSAWWLDASEPRKKPYPKALPPPPPSPIFTPSKEVAPDEAEIEQQARDHDTKLVDSIEHALRFRDAERREAAFTFLLPELLQVAPARAVDLLARLPEGEARATLRKEMARQWAAQDCEAAVRWMQSIEDPHEQRSAVLAALEALGPVAPEQAAEVAKLFHLDHSLERLADQNEIAP